MCKEEILFHYLDSGIQMDGAGDKKTDKATNSRETEKEESETEKLKRLLSEQKANKEAIWLYAELFLGHHDGSCHGLW